MSPRNFARLFLSETGRTPAKFVEHARVEAARCQLEQTDSPIKTIAEACGFGTAERMRRSFQRLPLRQSTGLPGEVSNFIRRRMRLAVILYPLCEG
ncbi:MAG: helix-turn-helix domain-containing protein [Alphaproteobacteria bacterium]|nr:helix-turn-helix domain-containing protein [Alphaproteobacteria bacterium]